MRDPSAVRQPGYLLFDRPLGFAPPPRGGFAFLVALRRQHAASAAYSCERVGYVRSRTASASEHQGSAELLRTPFRRTPMNKGELPGIATRRTPS